MGVLDLPALRRHRSRRAAIVAVVLVVIVLGASVIAISLGASGITPARVFATLAGLVIAVTSSSCSGCAFRAS